jgi:hypothetical protein
MNALHTIQKTLKVGKDNRNDFGKYNYRNCSDILEAVKPLLPEGFYITLSDELVMIGERYYVKATATLSNGTESHFVTAFARESEDKKGMDDSQITGSTSSYARKYALNGLLSIDDTKDADSMDNSQHVTKKQAATTKQPSNQTIGDMEFSTLNSLLDETESDKAAFCKKFDIPSVSALPLVKYAEAMKLLLEKKRRASVQNEAQAHSEHGNN